MSTMSYLTMQQEVASRLRLDLNNAAQATLVKRWINLAQQDIWSRYDWPWALDREIVQTVPDKTAGTVSVAAAGMAVTGSGTAFAASDVGSFIQFSSVGNDWYKITASPDAVDLTIEAGYTGTAALASGTYLLRKMLYSTSAQVEKILDVRQNFTPARLVLVPFRRFDNSRPATDGASYPLIYVPWGYDANSRWTFTLYPTPSTIMNIEIRLKKKCADLVADGDVSLIPEKWHGNVLINGALVRGLEYVRTADDDKRAEMKRQEVEAAIERMVEDADPESDWLPIMENRDVRRVQSGLRLPGSRYGE